MADKVYDDVLSISVVLDDTDDTDDLPVDGVIAMVQGVSNVSICVSREEGLGDAPPVFELPEFIPGSLSSNKSALVMVEKYIWLVVVLDNPIENTYAFNINAINNKKMHSNKQITYGPGFATLVERLRQRYA